jgi:hypothetical protein
MLSTESGADVASSLLTRYDRDARAWSFPMLGEFWDAVRLAHELGRRGDGVRIAVVDTGFDVSIPALAEHRVIGANDGPTVHGTCVALLVLAVAPGATLELYPVATATGLDEALVRRAVEAAAASGADVVNLSLGEPTPTPKLLRVADAPQVAQAAQQAERTDDIYEFAEFLRTAPGWRALFEIPDSPLVRAAQAAARSSLVIAAAGNAKGHLFTPAIAPDVLSVSFARSTRSDAGPMETAEYRSPSFSQSEFVDFGIGQPGNVIGTSFASPLLSGFAALMPSPRELFAYRRVQELVGIADQLLPGLPQGAWDDHRHGTVDRLYMDAVKAGPHSHFNPEEQRPCPECAVFGANAYVNLGLLRLTGGDLDAAFWMLTGAWAFAPSNPYAAANLALVFGRRADECVEAGNVPRATEFLTGAIQASTRACELRPDYPPYRRRLEEFSNAVSDPAHWRLAP